MTLALVKAPHQRGRKVEAVTTGQEAERFGL